MYWIKYEISPGQWKCRMFYTYTARREFFAYCMRRRIVSSLLFKSDSQPMLGSHLYMH